MISLFQLISVHAREHIISSDDLYYDPASLLNQLASYSPLYHLSLKFASICWSSALYPPTTILGPCTPEVPRGC
jgi:hypothetical protein